MYNSSSIDTLNRVSIRGEAYQKTDLNIKKTDDETRNVISNTFGHLKNNIYALFQGTGLNENVTMDIYKISSDPNLSVQGQDGRVYYPQSLVGIQNPYTQEGNNRTGFYSQVYLA